MPTNTRTVVFTDLVDYTRSTARVDRESLRRLVTIHEEYTRKVFEAHGGRLIKNLGDSFLTLFSSATEALRASLELVEGGLPGTNLMLRASAATGDVEEIDGDVFGEAVNISARINSRTPPGELWFTNSCRLCINQSEVPWEPVGMFELKGIPEEVECFRVVPSGTCVLPPPVALAARNEALIRLRPGLMIPRIPPNAHVIFEGVSANSPELQEILAALPVLDPANMWLNAYMLPAADRKAWQASGRGLIIGTTMALDASILAETTIRADETGGATVFLDGGLGSAALELALVGLALLRVPIGGVVSGYTYDFLSDGNWGHAETLSLLRLQVLPDGRVVLIPKSTDIIMDGQQRLPGDRMILSGPSSIQTRAGMLRFIPVQNSDYIGIIVGEASKRLEVAPGNTAEMGRDPHHPGVALPDRAGQGNLQWCTGIRAERTRAAGFTLDRALVGRHMASAEIVDESTLIVRPLHQRLSTWLFQCASSRLEKVTQPVQVDFGDMVVMGTNVVALRLPPG